MEKTLKEIIEEAPESNEFKPIRVGTRTFRFGNKDVRLRLMGEAGKTLEVIELGLINSKKRNSGCTAMIKQKIYEHWKSAERKGYVEFSGRRVYLLPIEPESEYNYLVHRGLIINGTDNLENLSRYGVFGNPSPYFPTYLMAPRSHIVIGRRCKEDMYNKVTLFLDIEKLLEKRSIFIDPETIGGNGETMSRNIEGESFFVLGGIPKEAIKEYRRYIETPSYRCLF